MDFILLTNQLAEHADCLHSLVQGYSDEQARWKPSPATWSVVEVVNHLYDEEREDFRAHLDVILHHPEQPWPRIDPQAWVTARQYNQRSIVPSLASFLKARQESLEWLQGLSSPDWDAAVAAPFGPLTAGDMFTSWVAHDVLHMRQLVELHWARLAVLVNPYRVDYAGGW